ncbi:MAG: extracellular solute-binding protein [Treponema sp.]|nr:extracellular solute-binding protein [Treponema sp.]
MNILTEKKSIKLLIFTITLTLTFLFPITAQNFPAGIKINVGSEYWSYDTDTLKPRNEGDAAELALRTRIQNEHGFRMSAKKIAGKTLDDFLPTIIRNITSKNKEFGIYQVAPHEAMELYKRGLLYPVSDSKAVNLKNREEIADVKPMYSEIVEKYMTFGGKQYAWNYGLPNSGFDQIMLYFNINHLTDAGLEPEYIYDLQKNNNWTWDTFLDLCRKLTRDINNDGITDIYALPCGDAHEIIRTFIFANGGNMVAIDSQGRARSTANSQEVIEALQFYNTLISEGLMLMQDKFTWDWNWEVFYEQRVSMTFEWEVKKFWPAQNQFKGGYALPPRGPRSKTLRLDVLNSVYVIPNIFSPEEVDVFLKAAELWHTPAATDYKIGHNWASGNIRDITETVAMSKEMRYLTPRNYQLIKDYPFDNFVAAFRNGNGKANPRQVINTWMPRFQSAIDNFNRRR